MKIFFSIVGAWILLISCTFLPENEKTFHELAENYALFMIEEGRDRYGEVHSPVFLSMLDRANDSLIISPEERLDFDRATTGIRNSDRSLNGANPFNDESLYVLLHKLSEDKSDPKFAEAADQSLSWLIENTQHPQTKLIGWGEHLGYRCDLDEIVRHPDSNWGHLKHEIHGYWNLWPKVFDLEPEAAIDYAYSFWNYHVYDKESGLHAHQTRYDIFEPDSGYVFPRMAGHMIYLWTLAYNTADDSTVKEDMVHYIDRIVTTHNERRQETSKVLPFLHPQEGVVYKPFGNMEAAYEIHRAMALNLPDTILNKLQEYNRLTDQCFTQIHNKIDAGTVDLADTLLNVKKVNSSNLWCNSYGKATSLAKNGVKLFQRYRQNKHEFFKKIALRIADQYIGSYPECHEHTLRPEALSSAIDLQLYAYQVTDQDRYLQQAFDFGEMAKELFMDDASPLPKVFSEKFDHYEAITGGADLMLSFYHLSNYQ